MFLGRLNNAFGRVSVIRDQLYLACGGEQLVTSFMQNMLGKTGHLFPVTLKVAFRTCRGEIGMFQGRDIHHVEDGQIHIHGQMLHHLDGMFGVWRGIDGEQYVHGN